MISEQYITCICGLRTTMEISLWASLCFLSSVISFILNFFVCHVCWQDVFFNYLIKPNQTKHTISRELETSVQKYLHASFYLKLKRDGARKSPDVFLVFLVAMMYIKVVNEEVTLAPFFVTKMHFRLRGRTQIYTALPCIAQCSIKIIEIFCCPCNKF